MATSPSSLRINCETISLPRRVLNIDFTNAGNPSQQNIMQHKCVSDRGTHHHIQAVQLDTLPSENIAGEIKHMARILCPLVGSIAARKAIVPPTL